MTDSSDRTCGLAAFAFFLALIAFCCAADAHRRCERAEKRLDAIEAKGAKP